MKELDKEMYYGATSETIGKAKALRKNMTKAEELLWKRLNKKQILGLRFRRQHPINIFIADFYCHVARIVIELDGKIHEIPENKIYDYAREAELREFGLEILRFKNEEIYENLELVLNKISEVINKRIESPPWGI